ncbi:hypothetical protein DV737_g4320, partial [Chaetothyriales sp. CBS 132003]
MTIADLGSARRDAITAVDKGQSQPVNIVKLLKGRNCEVAGSEAGRLAAENQYFGNTAIARSAANEDLDNIGNGQSHRQAMAERLLYTGVLTLEGSYDDRAGQNADYRPLDPAIVAGEKDSRYGLEHLFPTPPLADPGSFMEAAIKVLPSLNAVSMPPPTVQQSGSPAPVAVQDPNVPSMTLRGVSLAVKAEKAEPAMTKSSRNEFRAPNISPDGLREGKPSPQMRIETKPVSKLIRQATKDGQLDVGRIRKCLERKEIDGLVEYLEQALGIKSAGPLQESVHANPFKCNEPGPRAMADSKTASAKTHSSQGASRSMELKPLTESMWAPAALKAQSATGRAPLKANPSKGNVSEALKPPHTATAFGADGMKAGQPRESRASTIEAESTAIFGDVTALCRLPGVQPAASRGVGGVKGVPGEGGQMAAKTKIKRTAAGPGYEALKGAK